MDDFESPPRPEEVSGWIRELLRQGLTAEAIQVVDALRAQGQPVWYMNALNEGHGYRKKENRDVYQQAAIIKQAEHAARAMGITNGIAKGDMVLTDDGPKVIEIAARLSGGWFSSDQVPLATGVDLIGAAIELALGKTPSEDQLHSQYNKGVAIRYFFPSPGRIKKIHNAKHFSNQAWVHRVGFFVEPGDTLEAVTDHTCRAGFVITTGKDREEAVSRALDVIDSVIIEVE